MYTIKCDTSHQPKRQKLNEIELKSIELKVLFFNIDCDLILNNKKKVQQLFPYFVINSTFCGRTKRT